VEPLHDTVSFHQVISLAMNVKPNRDQ